MDSTLFKYQDLAIIAPRGKISQIWNTIDIDDSLTKWTVLVSVMFALGAAAFFALGRQEIKVPVLLASQISNRASRRQEYMVNPRGTLAQGYATHKNKPFGVDSMDGVKLVVPLSYVDKLKSHPALSFQKSIDSDLLRPYTGVGGLDQLGVQIIHSKFNPTLPQYVPILHNLVKANLPAGLGDVTDWTSMKIHQHMHHLIAVISAFVMHGEGASKDPEWLDIIENYVMEGNDYAQALKAWPPFLRPVICRFLPHRHRMSALQQVATRIVGETLATRSSGELQDGSSPPTILHHLTTGSNEELACDVGRQAELQLLLAVASIHTTSSSILHCLYDLAARPEYVDELRQEVRDVMKDCGGTLTKEDINKLSKMDSFMKESQRLASPDLTTFQRMAIKSFTLQDGTFVPKGTKLELATSSINVDEEFFENPDKFDGLRFHHLRKRGERNLGYTSVGKSNLGWGVGRHACPGRFFADIEIKLVLSELLLSFDIKNPAGQPRHKNLEFEAIVFPDPEAEVMLRRI